MFKDTEIFMLPKTSGLHRQGSFVELGRPWWSRGCSHQLWPWPGSFLGLGLVLRSSLRQSWTSPVARLTGVSPEWGQRTGLPVTWRTMMVSYSIDILRSEMIACFPVKRQVLILTSEVLNALKFAWEITSLPQLQSMEELKLEPSWCK